MTLERNGDDRRQRLGQHFTPQDVAAFMVDWVLGNDHSSDPALHDPCFGMGAFLEPLRTRHPALRFTANEVDPDIVAEWERVTGDRADFVTVEDYLLSWDRRHRNIVCNPPYLRFQRFLNREAVREAYLANTGTRLQGYTNTASAFLLKSLHELEGGRLAYVMPLEFLNTGYGVDVKARLLTGGHLRAIVSLSCEEDVFPGLTTTVGIILYDSSASHSYVDFHDISAVGELPGVLERQPLNRVSAAELDPSRKWLPYLVESDGTHGDRPSVGMVQLDHYGRFIRGIETGANAFFKLRPSEAAALGLGVDECLNSITRSSQVGGAMFAESDFDVLSVADAPVLLFAPGADPSPGALEYIRRGEESGYHRGYMTSRRTPWYSLESRQPAPIWINAFSRGGYKAIRNWTDTSNLTCFHGFQPNAAGERHLDRLFLYLESRAGREVMSASRRRYGDGLDKFEPNDLNQASVPKESILGGLSESLVKAAMESLSAGRRLPDAVESFFGFAVWASQFDN